MIQGLRRALCPAQIFYVSELPVKCIHFNRYGANRDNNGDEVFKRRSKICFF